MALNDMSQMRISDAERDRVAATLREAAAEGRVTLDELDERLNDTYKAKTYADLEPVTADLPGSSSGAPSAGNLPTVAAQGGAVSSGAGDTLVLNAKGSHVTRKGHWEAPRRVEAKNSFGISRIDFREAVLRAPVTEVDVECSGGLGDVILPDGATAEVDVDASWFGTLHMKVETVRKPDAPHFIITGACRGGTMRVRYKRRFNWGGNTS